MKQARLSESVHSEIQKLIERKNKEHDRKNVTVSEVVSDLIQFKKDIKGRR